MKTNWQDPGSSEILSTHISGLQEIAGKIEDILDIQLQTETGVTLSEVYISETDRYRIFQAPVGKRNWAASPTPVIYQNGTAITTGFEIDYGGGAIVLTVNAVSADVFTADFSRIATTGDKLTTHLADTMPFEYYGAIGDGVHDDTQAVLNAVNNNEYLSMQMTRGKIYRIAQPIVLHSNIDILGSAGSKFLLDFDGDYGIKAYGTQGTSITLTANANEGDISVSVGDSTGISVGDLVQLMDNRNGTRYGREFKTVASTTSTSITFTNKLTLNYKTTYTAVIYKISGLENVKIKGLNLECTDNSKIMYLIDIRYGKHIETKNNKIFNHRYATAPTSLISMYLHGCYDATVENNWKSGIGNLTFDAGDSINTFACGKASIVGNKGENLAFGITSWMGVGNIIERNQIAGIGTNGTRALKIAGCYHTNVLNNIVEYFDTGIKHEDSGRNNLNDNQILNCGVGTGAIAISLQYINASAEGDYRDVNVLSNKIRNCTGSGIVGSDLSINCDISHNTIENVGNYGISVDKNARITHNKINGFGTYGIIFKPEGCHIESNHVYDVTNTKVGFWCINNTNPEKGVFVYNTSYNNPLNEVVWFRQIGRCHDNYIKDNEYVSSNPKAIITQSTTQSMAGSWTAFSFNTVVYDNLGMFAAGIPSVLTIKKAGHYVFKFYIQFDTVASGHIHTRIVQNSTNIQTEDRSTINSSGQGISITTIPVLCAVGDVIKPWAYQTSGANVNVLAGATLSVEMVP